MVIQVSAYVYNFNYAVYTLYKDSTVGTCLGYTLYGLLLTHSYVL